MDFEEKKRIVYECVSYVEERIQEYINENLENILIDLLDKKYDNNLKNFINAIDEGYVNEKYKEILNKKGKEYISEFVNDNVVDLDLNDIYDIVFTILNTNKEIFEKFDEDLFEFAENHIDNPKLNLYFTSNQLEELNDEIGDKITNLTDRDYYNREKCFIDINGEILVSDEGETHAQLVNKYLKSINKETRKNDFYRPTNSKMEEFAEKFGFGEIDNGIFFIEDSDSYGNMSAEEIVDDILKSGIDYKKIYINKKSNGELLRAASRR